LRLFLGLPFLFCKSAINANSFFLRNYLSESLLSTHASTNKLYSWI
jgi:hypothetical protein